MAKWKPPQEGVDNANFDGSLRNEGSSTIGVIIRDHRGGQGRMGNRGKWGQLTITLLALKYL